VVLLHGRPERALRFMWDDIGAATVAATALVAVAWPAAWALRSAGAPVLVELALVVPGGGLAYLGTLRLFYPAAWHDLLAGLRRVLPGRLVALAVAPDRKWLPRRRVVRA
jgi:hypothetical protein